jgi:hypothetical protein
MEKLHPVGFTAELDGLLLSSRKGAKTARYVVPLDGKLLKMLADADRDRGRAVKDAANAASPRLVRPESALTPRELQDRIRAGWSIDEVAAEAGVDRDWVRRFAAPVLAEIGRVIEHAQATTFDKPRVGLSSLPLGAAVRRNVAERGVRLVDEDLDDAWSAYQMADDQWVVRFAYTSRGRLQEAEWFFDLASGELVSGNRLASQLGHVARRRSRPVAAPASKPPAKKKAAARKKPAAKKAATKKAAAKKPAVRKAAAKRKASAAKKKAPAAKRTASAARKKSVAKRAR